MAVPSVSIMDGNYLYEHLLTEDANEGSRDIKIDAYHSKFHSRQMSLDDDESQTTAFQSARISSTSFPTMSRFSSLMSARESFAECDATPLEALLELAHSHGVSAETIQKCGSSLTVAQFAEFKAVFDYFDLDGGGSISIEEFLSLFNRIDRDEEQEITKADIVKFLQNVDEDGDNEIDLGEFVIMMSGSLSLQFDKRKIRRAFETFAENDDDNLVDLFKLKQIMNRTHCVLDIETEIPLEQVEALLQLLPQNNDGCLLIDKFLDSVM